jgi:hypothetical protein
VTALSSEIEASAVRQVNGHLRELAEAERDIARNLERRNARDLAAVHNRMAQLYTERQVTPAENAMKGEPR